MYLTSEQRNITAEYLQLLWDFISQHPFEHPRHRYGVRDHKIAAVMWCGKNFAVWKTAGSPSADGWQTPDAPNNIIHVRLATGSVVEPSIRIQLEQVQRVRFASSPPTGGPYQYLCLHHNPYIRTTERVNPHVLTDGGKKEENQFITPSAVSWCCCQLYFMESEIMGLLVPIKLMIS